MIDFLLKEFVTIFAVSAVVVVLFNFLKQPSIVGFIITGILVGPFGFGWIKDTATIHVLAEVGLIFLLFSIGIEVSIKSLSSMLRAFLALGTLQMGITSGIVCLALYSLGFPLAKALLIGFLVSLSSTAIALNLLHRRRELLSPQGKITVSVLLFQDLFAVPLLLVLPLFSTALVSDSLIVFDLLMTLAKASLLLIFVFLGSRYFVPLLLKFITGTKLRELFLITIAVLAFGSAWLGAQIGLSVVLGAFLAGMLVSETQYGHQVIADLVPLREPFVALFFVSVGMLLDLNYFLIHWKLVLALAIAVIILKVFVSMLSALLLRYDLRISILMALLLGQVGEFSFIIAEGGFRIAAITVSDYQTFLAVSILTMLINPTLVLAAPKAISLFEGRAIAQFFQKRSQNVSRGVHEGQQRRNHVIIIGLGVIGQHLAGLLTRNEISFVGIETDPKLFHRLNNMNVSMIFGDGAKPEILEAADVKHARLIVVAINDANWAAHVVATVRHLRPDVRVIVRCQHFKDMEALVEMRVDEFIVAEAQMAVEFSERVLKHFGVPKEIIADAIEETERDNYLVLRS